MRVLHTEWSDGWGGQEIRVVSEMTGLSARGHDLTLVTRRQCKLARPASEGGIRVQYLPFQRAFDFKSIVRLSQSLRRERVQVVNTHSGVDSWVGSLAARLAGTPVLVRTRHVNIPVKRHLLNFVHALPDCIITCGEAIRENLVRSGFSPDRIANIPTGVDLEKLAPRRDRDAVRASLGVPPGAFIILMVGILRRVKSHETAFAAIQQVRKIVPDVRLLLAGDGPLDGHLRKAAAEMGLQAAVQFLGFRDDVADLLLAADLFLLTSTSEGVPQSVAQALALGRPVVASNVGGVPELIQHQRTGLLFPAGDAAAAAALIRRVMADPSEARKLGETGQAHVRASFSRDAMVGKVEGLCGQILERKTGASPKRP